MAIKFFLRRFSVNVLLIKSIAIIFFYNETLLDKCILIDESIIHYFFDSIIIK